METISSRSNLPPDQIAATIVWQETGEAQKKLFVKRNDTVEIGRDYGNDLILSDPEVSRFHAVLVSKDDGGFELSDLGSTNGSLINGKLIEKTEAVNSGDMIRVGDTFLEFIVAESRAPQKEYDLASPDTFIVRTRSIQPRLIITTGKQEGKQFPLSAQTIQIGRETSKASWDIALQDKAVSRPHAELRKEGAEYILKDLDSANGTLLNGKPLGDEKTLQDGDVIVFGETTMLYRAK